MTSIFIPHGFSVRDEKKKQTYTYWAQLPMDLSTARPVCSVYVKSAVVLVPDKLGQELLLAGKMPSQVEKIVRDLEQHKTAGQMRKNDIGALAGALHELTDIEATDFVLSVLDQTEGSYDVARYRNMITLSGIAYKL